MRISVGVAGRARGLVPLLAVLAVVLPTSPVRGESPAPAADTVVVVVSANSPVTSISRLHLSDLYLGRSTRFPDGSPATPIDQKPGSASRIAFLTSYLGRSESQMKSHWSKLVFTGRGRPPPEAATPQAMKDLVTRNPRAIGYLDARLVDSSVRVLRVR